MDLGLLEWKAGRVILAEATQVLGRMTVVLSVSPPGSVIPPISGSICVFIMFELINFRTYSGSNFVNFLILWRKKEEMDVDVVSTTPGCRSSAFRSLCLCGESEEVRAGTADLLRREKE